MRIGRIVKHSRRGSIIRIFPCLLLLVVLPVSAAWAWQIGHTQATWTDPARSNRSIPTEIYYPAVIAGESVPVGDGTAQFPVVVFGHGYLMVWSAYQNIWETLATEGYIVAFPKTEGSLFPDHGQFGLDLAFLVNKLRTEGTNPTSAFFGRVASSSAVMGHSMGGGASILAAADDPGITAVVNLAAAETNPSAIAAAQAVSVPVLMFAGSLDCVAPPAQHQIPIYEALASDCRTIITLTGGSHCQFAESNFNCSLGELSCSPTLTRSQQHDLVNLFMIPWLAWTLDGDTAAWEQFQSLLAGQGGITHQQDCPAAAAEEETRSPASDAPALRIMPNPFQQNAAITFDLGKAVSVELAIYNSGGRLVRTLVNEVIPSGRRRIEWNGTDSSGRSLPCGIYLCRLRAGDHLETRTMVRVR
jgi:dienelactone hydrolase